MTPRSATVYKAQRRDLPRPYHTWTWLTQLNSKCPPYPPPLPCSATVYKVRYRGEAVAAKEVDLGRSPAVQELFVRVGAALPLML